MSIDMLDFLSFLLGSMVMYLCMSQSILVAKSYGGGWRKLLVMRGCYGRI